MDILIEQLNGGLLAAAVDKARLVGLEVDTTAEEVRWGSIYWAKVARIDKALDAAFVNLDGDNIGLLNNADVLIKQKDGTYKRGGDVAIGKVLEPGQMIAVQAQSSFISKDPDEPYARGENKVPKVSMNLVLHGRYVIYAPMEGVNRISKRIRDKDMREQMEQMLESLADCKGCILRAASANTQTDILVREARILDAAWGQIQGFLEGSESQLIMEGPDAIQRILSDLSGQRIDQIELTTMDHFHLVEEWCDIYAPDLVPKITPLEIEGGGEELGLFEYRDIVDQIERLFHPYVMTKEGGSIIIQETSALTAVDVNSGQDKRSVAEVNTAAAKEIAKQLRLRNLGGIIMIDFLKTKSAKDRKALQGIMQKEFDTDPCTVQIHGWTKLGLLEVARHRRTAPLIDRFSNALDDAY